MARDRHCRNCGWYGQTLASWCDDCWRAGLKAAAGLIAAQLTAAALKWWFG